MKPDKKTTQKRAATPPTKSGSQHRLDIAEVVFEGMRNGLSAFKACQQAGVHQSTFNNWLNDDATMAAHYARARDDLVELIASEMMDLADSEVPESSDGKKDWAAIQKHKLQVDTRKWLLSKLAPKKFGDRLAIAGDEGSPLKIEQSLDVSKLSDSALKEILAAKNAN